MALRKDVAYVNMKTGEQVNTNYHILTGVQISYKSPTGGDVVGIVQSYVNEEDRKTGLYTTPFRQAVYLAGHKTEVNFFLSLENENVLQKCYTILKNTELFIGAEDC